MQYAIVQCLLERSKQISTHQKHNRLPPPPPPTPTPKPPPSKPLDTLTSHPTRTCHHPRCNLRSTHGHPPTLLTPQVSTCLPCRAFEEAISITILIEKQLRTNHQMRKTFATALPTISTMNSTPQTYMRSIHHTTITKYKLLSILLTATDTDPTLTTHLNTRVHFTTQLAGQNTTTQAYQTTTTLLSLILRVLAHPTPPSRAPEIPATTPTDTILAIAKALTPCQCSYPHENTYHSASPVPTHRICDVCDHLIFKTTPPADPPTQDYYSTCAVCQEPHEIPYDTLHPCQSCLILGLLTQQRTKTWWPQHISSTPLHQTNPP